MRQLCIVVLSTLSVLRGNYTYTYTNRAPLLADLFISLFVPTKTYFILGYLTKNGKKLAKSLGLQQTKSNAMDAGTIYPSGAPEITPIFSGVCVVRSVVSR
jgi:ethanolamine utilization microcompartment shell protein EutS